LNTFGQVSRTNECIASVSAFSRAEDRTRLHSSGIAIVDAQIVPL
jgi:hypothetical protein